MVKVIDPEGQESEAETAHCEYYYPHEIPGKVKSLSDIQTAIAKIQGDANTKFSKLPNEFKKLDCMYEIWDRSQLLAEDSDFAQALETVDREIVDRHNVVVYAAFLSSAKQWAEFNDTILKLRKGQRIMHGGLQLASDTMVQGDSLVIPNTSAIGYQAPMRT